MCSRLWMRIGFDAEPARAAQPPSQPMRSRNAPRIESLLGGRRSERLQHRQRQARAAARRVDRDVDGVAEAGDARAVLLPLGQALAPGLGRLRGALPRRRCPCARLRRCRSRARSPRAAAPGKLSSRLPRSPFGSMAMAGMPSIAASSSSDRHRPGLAAAGHADADRVRRQVARVVEQQVGPVRAALRRRIRDPDKRSPGLRRREVSPWKICSVCQGARPELLAMNPAPFASDLITVL